MYCIYCNRPIPEEQEPLPVMRKRKKLGIDVNEISRIRNRDNTYADRTAIIGYCCESCHDKGHPLIVIGKKKW